MDTDTDTDTYLAMLDRLAVHIKDCQQCSGRPPIDYCTEGWYLYTAIPLSHRPPAGAGRPLSDVDGESAPQGE